MPDLPFESLPNYVEIYVGCTDVGRETALYIGQVAGTAILAGTDWRSTASWCR